MSLLSPDDRYCEGERMKTKIVKMEKTCTYYWNKIAILHFADLDQEEKIRLAEIHLGKDEQEHLKELLAEKP